jgi:N6-L-threonylcarbamoyladenine synthase/protein kinase Bud32
MFMDELLQGDLRYWVVAESPWGLLGYAGLMTTADEGHVMNLAVRSDARGRGLGTALLSALVDEAGHRGLSRLTLEVRPSNAEAVALYERAGFRAVGRRPGYYSDSGEDGVIMWTGELAAPDAVALATEMHAKAEAALAGFTIERSAADPGTPAHRDLILAIETSCDETAAAVLRDGHEVLSSVVASQVDFHRRFGGVVPEIASRKHTEAIVGVVDEALEVAGVGLHQLSAIAVTHGPGLR